MLGEAGRSLRLVSAADVNRLHLRLRRRHQQSRRRVYTGCRGNGPRRRLSSISVFVRPGQARQFYA